MAAAVSLLQTTCQGCKKADIKLNQELDELVSRFFREHFVDKTAICFCSCECLKKRKVRKDDGEVCLAFSENFRGSELEHFQTRRYPLQKYPQYEKSPGWVTLSAALWGAGNFEEAIRVIEKIKSLPLRRLAFWNLLDELERRGEFASAESIVEAVFKEGKEGEEGAKDGEGEDNSKLRQAFLGYISDFRSQDEGKN